MTAVRATPQEAASASQRRQRVDGRREPEEDVDGMSEFMACGDGERIPRESRR